MVCPLGSLVAPWHHLVPSHVARNAALTKIKADQLPQSAASVQEDERATEAGLSRRHGAGRLKAERAGGM